ncbi:MAG TPA: phospholipase C, phosphocholine-specific [Candidatus Limnocylindria bacterium]|jgi:phospholipase C|nr:phospholipase C, phosphocholine-specific [Candidatus Limnocylindria bacterium]
MDSRRDFIRKAAFLAAGSGLTGAFPASIQRALAIDPPPGTTWLDAEHVVILMQENRSFDHSYGSLRGVRGFNDPRAVTLPDGNPVWLQTNKAGETYAPFRLNIKDTKATWMNCLPHTWVDQTDARNEGKHDKWLDNKVSGTKEYAHLPLTLGYYNRDDIPFYYDFADAFTVCDQNFCSSLTGTTPNRLHLWSGTIREKQSILEKANVRNEDADHYTEVKWTTYPERLEDHGVSWKIYQNEIYLPTSLNDEADGWLSNFGCNPIEYFTQFNVRYATAFRRQLPVREKAAATALTELEAKENPTDAEKKKITSLRNDLAHIRQDLARWTEANFNALPTREQNIHRKAFTTNEGDPAYGRLETLSYHDGTTERTMRVPKGDVFHQLRQDVQTGKLPTVSWIVPPENFSDHPCSPWYGSWYLSEALDILTQNPEVWKKTIFILCYDENDGYFDHFTPFVAPHPDHPETGKASAGIDTSVEQVRIEQEHERQRKYPKASGRAGPIGLGYRVPLVIASPWSRGGYVCSQVFDHTSILQMLEKFVAHKTGRPLLETNISEWRRTVCGDLTAAFRPYSGEKLSLPTPVERQAFLGSIHQAQFRPLPNGFKKFEKAEIEATRKNPAASPWLAHQEPGVRPSCALPYELAVEGALGDDRRSFIIQFSAKRDLFGSRAAGAPFHVYSPAKSRLPGQPSSTYEAGRTRAYAVKAGDQLSDHWVLEDFADGAYHLRVLGPNGFLREFRGHASEPALETRLEPALSGKTATGDAVLHLTNRDANHSLVIELEDAAYGAGKRTVKLAAAGTTGSKTQIPLELRRSRNWYDLRITVAGQATFERRYAGRIETGHESVSDPFMGRVVV